MIKYVKSLKEKKKQVHRCFIRGPKISNKHVQKSVSISLGIFTTTSKIDERISKDRFDFENNP